MSVYTLSDVIIHVTAFRVINNVLPNTFEYTLKDAEHSCLAYQTIVIPPPR